MLQLRSLLTRITQAAPRPHQQYTRHTRKVDMVANWNYDCSDLNVQNNALRVTLLSSKELQRLSDKPELEDPVSVVTSANEDHPVPDA